MSRAIEWTGDMEAMLREMRAEGCTCIEIASALAISKNAVINRCDRLGLVTGNRFRFRADTPGRDDREDRDDTPLPPGHPVSWGAITGAHWPGPHLQP